MRRLLAISSAMLCVGGAVVLTPGVAAAAPTVVCTVDDGKLPKITGITAVEGGYVVVDSDGDRLRLYKLDAACKPTEYADEADIDPNSPQDLAQTPDKTIWVADVGDDGLERTRVAVHKVAPGGQSAQIFRLTYPDGKHNAAAMVVQPDGVPVIITKEAGGIAKLYTTAAPLTGSGTVPLKPAGTLQIPASTTSGGPIGPAGRSIVTGAALSPDGKKVLVRTYTDVFEWDVAADIPTALKGKPKQTPLPEERDGQAVTYTVDGVGYVTISASRPSLLLEWTPAAPPEEKAVAKPGAKKAADDGFSLSKITQGQLGAVLLIVGLLGLGLLVAGVVGIVRFRKQRGVEDELDRRPPLGARPRGPGEIPRSPIDSPETVAFQRVGGSVYGGAADKAEAGLAPAGAGAGAGAAGAGAAGAASRGTVYGGGGAAGAAGAGAGAVGAGAAGAGADGGRRGSVYGGGPAADAGGSRGTVYGGNAGGPAGPGAGGPGAGGAGAGGPGAGGDGGRRGSVYGGQPTPPPPPGVTNQMPAGGHGRPPAGQARPAGSARPSGAAMPPGAVPGGHGPGGDPRGAGPGVARPGAAQGRPAGPPPGQARPGQVPPPGPPPGQGWSGGGEPRPAGTTYGGGGGGRAAGPPPGPQGGPPGPPPGQPEGGQVRSGRHDGSGRRAEPDETKQWAPQREREPRDWRSRQPRD